MRKSPVNCPVCHRNVIFESGGTVCFEVEGRICRVVQLKDVPADTKAIISCVHETCVEQFTRMVAAGQYPGAAVVKGSGSV
jgi:hypothetical protein